jgi:hypothetical protein
MSAFSHIHVREVLHTFIFVIHTCILHTYMYFRGIHTCIFVNKVRRLSDGGTLLIILLSLAALKRVNTMKRILVSAEQFYYSGGGGGGC